MKSISQIIEEVSNSLFNETVKNIDHQLLLPPLRYQDDNEWEYAFVSFCVPGYPPFNLPRIATTGADILKRLRIAYQDEKGYTFEVYGPTDAPDNVDGVIWRVRISKKL
jgi:hypothetical protein